LRACLISVSASCGRVGSSSMEHLRLSFSAADFSCALWPNQMQVKAYGELSSATKRRLREIAAALRNGNEDDLFSAPRIKPGTQMLRVWQDQTHLVTVLPDGFEWRGTKHKSLSAIAREITGTNWNGYAFFGLKRRTRKKPPPATPEHGYA
jgi:Protein of unknown function (DUF2924)